MSEYKSYQNNALIISYSNSENIDKVKAMEHFYALKEFLKLSTIANKPCFPSKDLDGIWHTFILFTKDYHHFCVDILGKFVHHIPFVTEDDKRDKFQPGYFCYIENKKFKKKYVKSLNSLEYIINCGSGGDCSSLCSSDCKTDN